MSKQSPKPEAVPPAPQQEPFMLQFEFVNPNDQSAGFRVCKIVPIQMDEFQKIVEEAVKKALARTEQ